AQSELLSAIAVPLLHEARLVGSLAVGTDNPGKSFTQEDIELIETLASTAAAALQALEHARLDGVLLAARTAQHELNNQLAVARGYAEMLAGSPDLPPHLAEFAEEVKSAADDAADTVPPLGSCWHQSHHRAHRARCSGDHCLVSVHWPAAQHRLEQRYHQCERQSSADNDQRESAECTQSGPVGRQQQQHFAIEQHQPRAV